MNKKESILIRLLCMMCMCAAMLCFTGCSSGETMIKNEGTAQSESAAMEANNENDVYIQGKTEIHYTERDLSGEYEQGTEIELSKTYTVSAEGVYIFSGTLENGQIIVDAADDAKVQIVLAGVNLTCKDGPAIYVKSADKVFLTLAGDTENTVSDGNGYTTALIAEDEPWGAVFSKDDLTINGSGMLHVYGNYLHGIVSKDSLKITGGTIDVTAVEDGLRGKDEICIHDGLIAVTCKEDGLKANNDEDEGRGNVSIDGGTVNIDGAASQGIDAYNIVQILGGSVDIHTDNEGIQGKHIYIEDGNVNVDAVDDCLNAKDSLIEDTEANHEDALLEIAGGKLILTTSDGDGLDSNGSILVSGGKTIVHGSSGGVEVAMDYNGTAAITGGEVLATGASGMAQNFEESSSQCSLMYGVSGNGGTVISLSNGEGTELVSFEARNDFSSVIISTPELKVGETYTLTVGGSEVSIELRDTITSYGGMDGPGGGHGGFDGHDGGGHGGPGNMGPM